MQPFLPVQILSLIHILKALKEGTKLPIQLHTHYTSGVASMTYMKAVEAGCDIIDTALSPLAMGTSQPATEVMAKAFEGTEFDPGFDQMCIRDRQKSVSMTISTVWQRSQNRTRLSHRVHLWDCLLYTSRCV